jgi:hypothetical protein
MDAAADDNVKNKKIERNIWVYFILSFSLKYLAIDGFIPKNKSIPKIVVNIITKDAMVAAIPTEPEPLVLATKNQKTYVKIDGKNKLIDVKKMFLLVLIHFTLISNF